MAETHELPPPYTVETIPFHYIWHHNAIVRGLVVNNCVVNASNEAQQAERNYWQPIHEADRKRIADLEVALSQIADHKWWRNDCGDLNCGECEPRWIKVGTPYKIAEEALNPASNAPEVAAQ